MPVGPYDDFDECVADNQDKDDPEAFCAYLEQETSRVTGDAGFTGAVITLLPAAGEVARLALDGGEDPDALHVTLAWLGDTDGDPAPEQAFTDVVTAVAEHVRGWEPVEADAFAVAVFNPDGYDAEREPATVLLLQSDALAAARGLVADRDVSDFAVWFPHLTLGYALPALEPVQVAARVGPVTFDRIAVAYGDERVDITLGAAMTAATRVRVNVPERYRRQALQDETVEVPPEQRDEEEELASAWEGVLVVEGEPTGDGRLMEPGSMRWEDLPLPLRWAREDQGMHVGAVVVGRITEVWRDGTEVRARGDFDLDSEHGREAARQVAAGLTQGISVDLDDVDMEVRVAADVLEEMEREMAALFDEDGEEPEEEEREVDEDGRVTVAEFDADDELLVTTDGRIRAATLVDIPAFTQARIEPADEEEDDDAAPDAGGAALVASSDQAPPASWFADPQFGADPAADVRLVTDEHTGQVGCPLTVTDDGRVYGHLATWRTCHTAFADECVSPPVSEAGYRYFRTGATRTRDGSEVATGRITLDTMHAGRRSTATDALAHYEHTGTAVADVSAGEDQHGIWVAGALRAGVSDEDLRVLRASPLSGDWRRIGGNLELVAALAVNSPGFPVPRALVAGGTTSSLQSAGVVPRVARKRRSGMSRSDRDTLNRLIARERAAERTRAATVEQSRLKVLAASAASRVRGGR